MLTTRDIEKVLSLLRQLYEDAGQPHGILPAVWCIESAFRPAQQLWGDRGKGAEQMGANSYCEIILGLPGDSLEAHMRSVQQMVDGGIRVVKIFLHISKEQQRKELVERMLKSSGRRVDLSQPFVDDRPASVRCQLHRPRIGRFGAEG